MVWWRLSGGCEGVVCRVGEATWGCDEASGVCGEVVWKMWGG